ncbi:MAG TPA: hypothetical protein P5234_11395 [Thermoanaerobaculaceae bacterium]|nr:hypothetical protein [Thermoanaerobaculaceae bacterium]HRS16835.1 hypothetical protein [Thermoanaerobaculaceae bacterium]
MRVQTTKQSFACAALTLSALAFCTADAAALTVRGSLTYDGQPLASTFSPYAKLSVKALLRGSEVSYAGTINFAASTYEISGLPVGSYDIYFLLTNTTSREAPSWPRAGELWVRAMNQSVGSGDPTVLDVPLLYTVHLTRPHDSSQTWPGGTACPGGPALPDSFTLGWDPVPRATRYEVIVEHYSCSEYLAREVLPTTGTSVEVTQGVDSGEMEAVLTVKAFGASGGNLAMMPWISYQQGGSTGTMVHRAGSLDRQPGSTTGQHIAQVAHVAGVGSSFWVSDLTLTNPTANPISATLYFTPRGADGLTAYREATVEVPARSSRTYSDVVASVFGTTGAGSLEVASPGLVVSSRTFTTRSGGGTYGQGYPPVRFNRDNQINSSVLTSLVGGGVVKGAFRTNLTLCEVWGDTTGVRIELYDRSGNKIGQRDETVPAYGNIQVNDVVSKLSGAATLTEGTVRVFATSGAGWLAGFLSIVDNTSDDPTTVLMEPRY